MSRRFRELTRPTRRGVAAVGSVLLVLAVLGLIALAVELGSVVLVRTQLQAASDSAALAAAASMAAPRDAMTVAAGKHARRFAVLGKEVRLKAGDVEYGTWDASRRSFLPSPSPANAVRVATRTDKSAGEIVGKLPFAQEASAVAAVNPRDIALVVDLSGSMNDDTEPCWVRDIAADSSLDDHPAHGHAAVRKLYEDFGFGSYPGVTQHVGQPWGVARSKWAYAELTEDGGPLTAEAVPDDYRIRGDDDELTRKQKAYSAIIDFQIAALMPRAKPLPDSTANYAYWKKYLDYLVDPVEIDSEEPPGGGGRIPPGSESDCIDRFNRADEGLFSRAVGKVPRDFRNQIGYLSYVQFMLDHGRDLKPVGDQYVPLSGHSPDCPRHAEATPGGTFQFPPRTEPMHGVRRGLIAAIEVIKQHNLGIADPQQRDRISIIAFDGFLGGGPFIEHPLSCDYDAAMLACTRLQAVGDKGPTTAVESGLIAARELLQPQESGGQGRPLAGKIVVLLSDGGGNLYVSRPSDVDDFLAGHNRHDFYGQGAYAYDASLMQAMQMRADHWRIFPIGVGLNADEPFMARLAGMAEKTAESGDPIPCEQRLSELFRTIVTHPQVRLVQ